MDEALQHEGRRRAGILLVALLLAVAAYHNATSGEFVWDDDFQIVRNETIQNPDLYGEALSSDVWAFGADAGQAGTRYWRPMFVLWMIASFRLFGLDPFGWHVTTILLHLGVIALCSEVLRRLGASLAVSAATLWLFAVHPVHVESVTWIAGATDPLLAVFLLAAYVTYLGWRNTRRRAWLVASLLLFVGAVTSKEVSVLFPVLVAATELAFERRWKRGLLHALPYAAIVLVFLAARGAVLGDAGTLAGTVPRLEVSLLTAPRVLLFYLRQIVWPVELAPVYPLQPVTLETLGWASFGLPLLVLAIVAAAMFRLRGRQPIAWVFFLLPLAPVLNTGVFPPDRLVHDRFLYLALFGALWVLADALSSRLPARVPVALALLLVVPLTVATLRYNRAWDDDVRLWEHASRVHPDSAFALGNLGYYYREAGRIDEAKPVLQSALRIDPQRPRVLVDLGLVALAEQRYVAAVLRFEKALALDPTHAAALDRLAALYTARERYDDALELLERARASDSRNRLRSTVNIAVLYKKMGRNDAALLELEGVRAELEQTSNPQLSVAFWHLGELYAAVGRPGDAIPAYETFLKRTAGAEDPMIETLRGSARERLSDPKR